MNHPLGPLALADLIGLDTCLAILEVLHDGFGDPKFRPCPLWRQYVEAGRLGRKAGRGFHDYRLARSGQLGALATVALWCASFALIKHLVDAGLAAPDVALGRYPGGRARVRVPALARRRPAGPAPRRGAADPRGRVRRRHDLPPRAQRRRAHDRLGRRGADRRARTRRDARARARRRAGVVRAAPPGGHRAGVRGRRCRRRAGLGRELLAGWAARPAARAARTAHVRRLQHPLQAAPGPLRPACPDRGRRPRGRAAVPPLRGCGRGRSLRGARRGRLDLARRARPRRHARRLRHVEHRPAGPRALARDVLPLLRAAAGGARSAPWRWASP